MTNLPFPAEGPIVPIRNPEEFAAMLQANTWLNRIVADHRKELQDDREEDTDVEDEFLWGQDFEISPEVWDDLDPRDLWDL